MIITFFRALFTGLFLGAILLVVFLSRPENAKYFEKIGINVPDISQVWQGKVEEVATRVDQTSESVLGISTTQVKDQAGQTAQQAQSILGREVQVASETAPLHQRALEYAQYEYCKQVVIEYEK